MIVYLLYLLLVVMRLNDTLAIAYHLKLRPLIIRVISIAQRFQILSVYRGARLVHITRGTTPLRVGKRFGICIMDQVSSRPTTLSPVPAFGMHRHGLTQLPSISEQGLKITISCMSSYSQSVVGNLLSLLLLEPDDFPLEDMRDRYYVWHYPSTTKRQVGTHEASMRATWLALTPRHIRSSTLFGGIEEVLVSPNPVYSQSRDPKCSCASTWLRLYPAVGTESLVLRE